MNYTSQRENIVKLYYKDRYHLIMQRENKQKTEFPEIDLTKLGVYRDLYLPDTGPRIKGEKFGQGTELQTILGTELETTLSTNLIGKLQVTSSCTTILLDYIPETGVRWLLIGKRPTVANTRMKWTLEPYSVYYIKDTYNTINGEGLSDILTEEEEELQNIGLSQYKETVQSLELFGEESDFTYPIVNNKGTVLQILYNDKTHSNIEVICNSKVLIGGCLWGVDIFKYSIQLHLTDELQQIFSWEKLTYSVERTILHTEECNIQHAVDLVKQVVQSNPDKENLIIIMSLKQFKEIGKDFCLPEISLILAENGITLAYGNLLTLYICHQYGSEFDRTYIIEQEKYTSTEADLVVKFRLTDNKLTVVDGERSSRLYYLNLKELFTAYKHKEDTVLIQNLYSTQRVSTEEVWQALYEYYYHKIIA